MKQFIKKIFVFTSIPLICLIVGLLIIFYISKTIDYKFNKSINEIYIGDSHIQCAVNDSLLNNSKNVSTSSESFYFSYYKLKKLIEENKNIEKVYLGVSYHSLSNYYDDFISGEYSPSVSPKYFYILPIKEQFKLIRWNLKNLPAFIKGIFSISYRYLFKDVTFDYGGYSNNFTNSMALKPSMEKRLHFQYYKGKVLNNFSEINLAYLTKIIALCKANEMDLVLLNTPLHPYFKSKIPIIYINKFNEIVNTHKLKVIDFSALSFSDSCFIPDGDHLSVKGACQLTKELLRIKHMAVTKAICNKGFSGNSSILPRSNFRVSKQESSPQSLTAYSLSR